MKAVKIKVPVNLTTGVEVPADSIAVIGQFYIDNKNEKNGKIPVQVPLLLYKSAQAFTDKKRPILEIADFNPMIEAQITVSDYETKDAETLGIKEIKQYLNTIYGAANVETVNI